ncbi:Conserved_hypothetical protein [Hexamita inflata]|uniref:Calcineurin-like phosphoesterase domain-containing protein n=1 Tax=Hexamita inflata TaxID=28002 RepID=A0ABP1GGE3_9EUKA
MYKQYSQFTGNSIVNYITERTTLIFIDFEAFSCNPLYPSEIGCVRVSNFQPVATLHAFISKQSYHEVINQKEVADIFHITKKITGIPVPWSAEFQQCQLCVKYDKNLLQFGQLLVQFCTASSQVLRNGLGKDINVQIFSEFEQNSDYIFLAKGIDLEHQILSQMMGIQNKVVEADDVHKQFFRKPLTFENLHSNRIFDFCSFHKNVPNANLNKIKHCALDDAVYLAKLFLHLVPKQVEENVEHINGLNNQMNNNQLKNIKQNNFGQIYNNGQINFGQTNNNGQIHYNGYVQQNAIQIPNQFQQQYLPQNITANQFNTNNQNIQYQQQNMQRPQYPFKPTGNNNNLQQNISFNNEQHQFNMQQRQQFQQQANQLPIYSQYMGQITQVPIQNNLNSIQNIQINPIQQQTTQQVQNAPLQLNQQQNQFNKQNIYGKIDVTCISDMHGEYNRLNLPGGDLLICAGDFLYSGDNYQTSVNDGLIFCQWLNNQRYLVKILVAGNHDLVFEKNEVQIRQFLQQYPTIRYLVHETINIEINGIKLQIFGSPYYEYHPSKVPQAFINDTDLRNRILSNIPQNTDIVITHGPSYGMCDQNYKDISCGSQQLKQALEQIKPKLHIFGHIHEANGIMSSRNTHHINAAIMSVGFSRDYSVIPIHYTSFSWFPYNNTLE